MTGPLHGIRIVEIAGIGPGPFAGMMLADHGAEVIRVDRPGAPHTPADPLLRSRRSVALDLKSPADVAALRDLCRDCDGLIEGFRPGVMERLGLGPDVLLTDNPRLVFGRMTGWGQTGPYAARAGHDINYIAISGVLGAVGRAGERPLPPINLVGDFGGGGMMLAFGMVSALLNVRNGGTGQVVDCAMTEGSALLMAMIWGLRAMGMWSDQRGVNVLDTGAPFYETYETADGEHLALGSIEPQFYQLLLQGLGMSEEPEMQASMDPRRWAAQKARIAEIIRTRSRADWVGAFEADACVAPVLSMTEALSDPHNLERQAFIEVAGVAQPAPAPRYSATPCAQPVPPSRPGSDNGALLNRT